MSRTIRNNQENLKDHNEIKYFKKQENKRYRKSSRKELHDLLRQFQ